MAAEPTNALTAIDSGNGKRNYLIAVVSDLGGGPSDRLTPIDKETFASVIGAFRPTIAIAIKDALGTGTGELEFKLSFDSMKSFEPTGLLKQFPAGSWRLGLREKVAARQTGAISPDDLTAACNAAAAGDASLAWLTAALHGAASGTAASGGTAARAGGSVLDSIGDPTDTGSKVSRDVEDIARSAGDPNARIGAGETTRLASILSRLDRELGALANAVLKHPDVARLETAWRSLKFLIDRVDFRENVRVGVVNSRRDDALDTLVTAIIEPTFDGTLPTPGLVVFDYWFTNNPADIEALDMLGQHCQGVPMPVTFPLDAGFFGVKSLRLIKNLPNLSGVVDSWQFAKWKALREKPYARALAPVVGRFVLRPLHAAKTSGEFSPAETAASIDEVRWAGGQWAMAVCAGRAFSRHGWPTRMFGTDAGKIEDLALVPNPHDAASPWGPGDLIIADRVNELYPLGMNALTPVVGKDFCALQGGMTVARPVITADHGPQSAATEVSLPYAQFANIVSAWLCEKMATMRGAPANEIQEKLIMGLTGLLVPAADETECIQVGVGDAPDGSGQTAVMVRVTPPAKVSPGGVHLDFTFLV